MDAIFGIPGTRQVVNAGGHTLHINPLRYPGLLWEADPRLPIATVLDPEELNQHIFPRRVYQLGRWENLARQAEAIIGARGLRIIANGRLGLPGVTWHRQGAGPHS